MSDQQKNPSSSILLGTIVVALVLIAVIWPLSQLGKGSATENTAEDADVRIQPVAKLEIQKAVAVASGKPRDGLSIFTTICSVCHNTGVAGSPKIGDKTAWGPRLAQGKEALYKSALNGKNAMPPRGGAADLSDAEVKSAVDHIIGLVK